MRGLRLASVALLACLVVSACQSDTVGPVDPDDTATPSTTTPPATGPTPPTLPEAARANTEAGATEFIEYYIELLNSAAATGDVSTLRASSRNCGGCEKYASLYEKTYADGGYYHGFVWTPVAPFADLSVPPAVVLVDVDTTRTRYKLSKSASEGVGPASTYKLRFELTRSGDGWVVTKFGLQGTGS